MLMKNKNRSEKDVRDRSRNIVVFFKVYLLFERASEHLKQALHCQHRAQHRAQTPHVRYDVS